jgi:hypothetical protein
MTEATNDTERDGSPPEEHDQSQQGNRRWLHRVDTEFLQNVLHARVLGSPSVSARKVREVRPLDQVMIVSTLTERPEGSKAPVRRIAFVAWAEVERPFESTRPYSGYDKCKVRLRLSRIGFFASPIFLDEVSDRLDFLSGYSQASKGMDFDYRDIPDQDFQTILEHAEPASGLPDYLKSTGLATELPWEEGELLSIFRRVYEVACILNSGSSVIKIRTLVLGAQQLLAGIGHGVEYQALLEAYAQIAVDTDFEHVKARDPQDAVALHDADGNTEYYGYVRLRRVT